MPMNLPQDPAWPAGCGHTAAAAAERQLPGRFGFAAAVPCLPSIGRLRQMSEAQAPVDLIRALAHPILEATGASVRATIAALDFN
jgi:hypothetical protein